MLTGYKVMTFSLLRCDNHADFPAILRIFICVQAEIRIIGFCILQGNKFPAVGYINTDIIRQIVIPVPGPNAGSPVKRGNRYRIDQFERKR